MTETKLPCLTDLTRPQLEERLTGLGAPAYRTGQVWRWLYRELAFLYDEMTDLPAALRQRLAATTRLHSLTPAVEVSGRGGTVKTLFALADGQTIESTAMPFPTPSGGRRYTICLSTQVGCPVACPFCATGQQGFVRNLTPGEIIDQVLYFARGLRERGLTRQPPVDNLVFMGMGEPLANYPNLLQAIETLNSPGGFGLGARHMTISTAGMVPQIKRLAGEKLQVGLAVSLHAANNELRNRLVPLNRRYPLEQLIPASREYFARTGRRPTFEYILFAGVNDSREQARALARLLRGMNCHVNLITANPTPETAYRPPGRDAVLTFQRELRAAGSSCTLRQSRGQDINAGCGQLRSQHLAAPGKPPA